MRIAILNPWFLLNGGGSKVVNVLAGMYPEADIFVLFYRDQSLPVNVRGRRLTASLLQQVPFIGKLYRPLLPIFPLAVESLDLRGYDLIINCDASLMKGAITDQHSLHVCYCHTPVRYLWDLYWTFKEQTSWLSKPVFTLSAHYLRQWDFASAQRVHRFVANSQYIARRIRTYYGRESTVIYPPVDTASGYLARNTDDYYLSVGRLTHTKRLEILIEACNRLKRRLLIAGTGREEKRLKSIAGSTIEFLGRVPDSELPALYAHCRALLFAADEDFGIVPVEAQSYGRPVLAYARGGSRETILDGSLGERGTGLFFPVQTSGSLIDCIKRFEDTEGSFDPIFIQAHVRQFDTETFVQRMRSYINGEMKSHCETI